MIAKEPFTAGERRAVLALASLYSFRMLGLFMVFPLLAIYARDMPGATPAMLGLALGAYGLTQAALQLPLGWLSDRVGRKPVILAGFAAFTLGSLVAANADTIYGVILGRFLQGSGAIAAALTALAADYTRDSQRTKTMAIIGASVGLSFAAALILGPLLASLGGLSLVFLVTAGMGLIGLALVGTLPGVAEVSVRPERGAHEVEHVLAGGLPVLYASIFMLHGLLMATFLLLPAVLVNTMQVPAEEHWQIYLGAIVVSLPPALMLMRAGRGSEDARWVLAVAASLVVGGALIIINAPSFMWLLAGLIVHFAGVNTLEAVLPSLVTRLAPGKLRGTAMGLFATAQFAGIFVGGTGTGIILGVTGEVGVTVLVGIVALAWLGLLFGFRLKPAEAIVSS